LGWKGEGIMDFLASGALQQWIMDVLTNNAKIIAGLIAIAKYFAVSTGDPGKNRILDLVKRGE